MPTTPSGFDRADGLSGRPGTGALPASLAAVKVQSSLATSGTNQVVFEELPDSPSIERAEQATLTHKYRCSYADGLQALQFLSRGVVRTDSYGTITKILSAKLDHESGNTGLLTVVEEGLSFDAPPDSYDCVPVELGIDIIKHPRYLWAFVGAGVGSDEELLNQAVIRRLQDYMANPSAPYRDALASELYRSLDNYGTVGEGVPLLFPNGPGTKPSEATVIPGSNSAKRAAIEIITKFWRGEETPYLIGYQLTWVRYYFRPPYLNPGGYMENPITEASPGFPAYFYSPTWPITSSSTIFDLMSAINPQSYSDTGLDTGTASISWLRKADQQTFERTFIRVTRTWIGTPVGHWDPELYTAQNGPQGPNDFLLANVPGL